MKSMADIYAIALIAASKALNVDPITALTVKGHEARKALYPAALAVQRDVYPQVSDSSVARSFGFSRSGYQSWMKRPSTFEESTADYYAKVALREAQG